MWKWHKYSISEAQGRQLMHTESTLVCLFISPLISVVLLLMSPGSRWHSKPFNHRLIHTHTHTHTYICTHITQQSISSNYRFTINYFPRHCSHQKTVIVSDWIDRMRMQSLWIQDGHILHSRLPDGVWGYCAGLAVYFLPWSYRLVVSHWSKTEP